MSIPATEAVNPGMYLPSDASTPAAGAQDKQMFLELMVAQLRYQDPMNPTDSSEFLAQTAQFTALEKMQDVADQTSALLNAQISFGASGLVGRQVTYLDEGGATVSGVVDSVSFSATGPALHVGDSVVTLSQIQSVDAAAAATSDPTTA